MAKIFYAEDDEDLAASLIEWLTMRNYVVEHAPNGSIAAEMLRTCTYDLIILDWEMPVKSGIEVLREFRARGTVTPVLMLTGRSEIDDKITGLDRGADDYLTKPFKFEELGARLRALLRRPAALNQNVLHVGDVQLDPELKKVIRRGVEIKLTPKEFAVLEFLMRHQGKVFSAETIFNRVWTNDSEATVDMVRTMIKRIRQKFGESVEDSFIRNVRNEGYGVNCGDSQKCTSETEISKA